ncbi:nitrilase [Nocardia uniformis]|uniref:Nitrilase n=1 Tax=Nocardia uniformis TaxID=53432 RepID=A0A849BWZ1_9NOCA|nr:hypothetical protein [Nocardia uniformis]NNH69678.1 nitrilase [Nocardia uniformis]
MVKQTAIAAIATLLSAVLWHFGTGLHPVAGLAFLAPLPVLLIAPSISAPFAFLAGALSWLGGEARMWRYFTTTLEQPVPVTVALLGGSALVFGAVILVFRALMLRDRPGLAVLAFPAGWVTFEYVLSLVGTTGAWWSIAYTQSNVLPFIQTAAITGVWGLTFLILLVPAALAVMANATRPQRIRIAAPLAVVAIAVAGFGAWHLTAADEQHTVRVGLVAVSQPPEYVPIDSPAGHDMLTRAIVEIELLADQGVRAVVLPEKAWRAEESTLHLLSDRLTEVAARRDIHIVAGLILTRPDVTINAAIAYPSGVSYAKHYLVPGLEEEFTAGTAHQLVPGEPWALAICFDLDRPGLVRENRRLDATLLLVPALDFTDDHWLHSRMAVMRGIESGVGIARAAQLGELVASDSRGHILASARTDIATTRSVLADIPLTSTRTVYARFGDWFAWLAVGLFLTTLACSFVRRRRGPIGS